MTDVRNKHNQRFHFYIIIYLEITRKVTDHHSKHRDVTFCDNGSLVDANESCSYNKERHVFRTGIQVVRHYKSLLLQLRSTAMRTAPSPGAASQSVRLQIQRSAFTDSGLREDMFVFRIPPHHTAPSAPLQAELSGRHLRL